MTDARRPEQLAPRGAEGLPDLMRRYALDGITSMPDNSWRLVARLMSDDARARGLLIEELLVGVKRAWPTVAESERIPRVASSHLLARFVTLCVEEYYGAPG